MQQFPMLLQLPWRCATLDGCSCAFPRKVQTHAHIPECSAALFLVLSIRSPMQIPLPAAQSGETSSRLHHWCVCRMLSVSATRSSPRASCTLCLGCSPTQRLDGLPTPFSRLCSDTPVYFPPPDPATGATLLYLSFYLFLLLSLQPTSKDKRNFNTAVVLSHNILTDFELRQVPRALRSIEETDITRRLF